MCVSHLISNTAWILVLLFLWRACFKAQLMTMLQLLPMIGWALWAPRLPSSSIYFQPLGWVVELDVACSYLLPFLSEGQCYAASRPAVPLALGFYHRLCRLQTDIIPGPWWWLPVLDLIFLQWSAPDRSGRSMGALLRELESLKVPGT